MLDVNDLVEGVTKVRILEVPQYVTQDVGAVGEFIEFCEITNWPLVVKFGKQFWYFRPEHLEIVEIADKGIESSVHQSEDLIIYKSRWDEIIESLEGGSNGVAGMTDEEVEIVKSVLKNNTPFNVVPDLVDPVISKEDQTHLDANYVGVGRNGCFYYRSDILKQWFYWNEYYEWSECDFDYNDIGDVLPVSFGGSK